VPTKKAYALKAPLPRGAGCNPDRASGNNSSPNSYNEPLEDEDDDEYENDVLTRAAEFLPSGVDVHLTIHQEQIFFRPFRAGRSF